MDDKVEKDLYNDGARPDKKDIFVEVDWMEPNFLCGGHKMSEDAKKKVKTAFAKHGIELHIVESEELGHDDVDETKNWYNTHFLLLPDGSSSDRKGIFHYAIFAHNVISEGKRHGGFAFWGDGVHMDSLAIADAYIWFWVIRILGGLPGPFHKVVDIKTAIAGAFMHELGHTLGLSGTNPYAPGYHRGIDNEETRFPFQTDWKKYENYESCMNYEYVWRLVDYSDGTHGVGDFDDWGSIDLTYFNR